MDKVYVLVLRLIGPLVAGLVTWFGSLGVALGPEFGETATTALMLLVMGVLTVVVNWLVRILGPLASRIFGLRTEE